MGSLDSSCERSVRSFLCLEMYQTEDKAFVFSVCVCVFFLNLTLLFLYSRSINVFYKAAEPSGCWGIHTFTRISRACLSLKARMLKSIRGSPEGRLLDTCMQTCELCRCEADCQIQLEMFIYLIYCQAIISCILCYFL